MLGYTFVVIGLLADLGRYYNVWHPMLPSMWQGNSVLFEVGMCVMVYLTVLYIEFLPIVVERFKGRVNLPGPLSMFNRIVESWLDSLRAVSQPLHLSVHHRRRRALLSAPVVARHADGDRADQDAPALVHADLAAAVSAVGDCGRLPDGDLRVDSGLASLLSSSRRHRCCRRSPAIRRSCSGLSGVKIGDLTLREAWPYVFEGHCSRSCSSSKSARASSRRSFCFR